MLQVHHVKYAVVTLKNPTDILPDHDPKAQISDTVYYMHNPEAKIVHWYPYNLVEHYESHLVEWVIFKSNMCSLNNLGLCADTSSH